jgi:type VI secretion system FHA domain protein
MLLALSIISSQAAALGATAYKVFDERGGSIGRVVGNDWVLPDPDNFVSSRHAAVRWAAGGFYLEDTSTNGTFINSPDRPVSRTAPVRLQDGDRLFIGDFEIIVQLIDATPAPPPSAPLGLGTVDPLAALGGGSPEPGSALPVSPPPPVAPPAAASVASAAAGGAQIPDNWDVTSFTKKPGAAHPVPPAPVAPNTVPPAAPAAVAPAPSAGAGVSGGTSAGANDLFAALGLDPSRVDPAVQQQLGTILRIAVQGLMDVLKSRAEVKNNFRLPITVMKPVENNPLKFSMNAEDALYNLFVKRNPGYLAPVEAFQEGFQDVELHQAAMLSGIRAAFSAMLAKLHPAHLEEVYERKLKRSAMLGLGSNRAKYWELYRERFEEIDRDREAHFQLLFGEDFARAYDEQLQKLGAEARRRKR